MNETDIQKSFNDQKLPEQIAKLKKEFHQLESASSKPRLYMTEYFANLINRIDISAEEYLNELKDQSSEISRQTRSDQSKMAEVIKERQSELFGSEFEEDLELLDKIRDIGLCLQAPISSNEVPGIGLEIEKTMFGLQRRIFIDKTLWFRVLEDLKDENKSSLKRFGILFVLEGEYIVDELSPDNMGYW